MNTKIEKWLNHEFSTGCDTGSDYIAFQKEAKNALKKKAKDCGLSIAEFNKNHYEFSAVLKDDSNGKLAFISIPDVRFYPQEWYYRVLYRPMSDSRDYSGKGYHNHYSSWDAIAESVKSMLNQEVIA